MTLDNNDTPRIYKYTFLLSDLNFVEVHVHSSSRKRHPVNVHFKSISYSHVNFPFSSLKGHQMDAHFKSGQDVDVYWIFVPKMDVHRTFCAIWVTSSIRPLVTISLSSFIVSTPIEGFCLR